MSNGISGLLFNAGEELPCQHEDGNRANPFAVAVVRGGRPSLATIRRRYLFALSIYTGC